MPGRDDPDHTGVPNGGLHQQLLELTLARGYIRREKPFTLSSGALSHDYVDMRRAVSAGEDLRLVAEAVIADLDDAGIAYDVIGGMTMGADPVAHAVALVSGCGWFSVRKAEKDHGSGNRVEGSLLGPGVRAVVFEDTTSTGRSILEALDVVLDTGASIATALTILDRGEQARTAFSARSMPYRALLSYRDLGIDPIGEAPAQDRVPTTTTS